MDSNLKEFYSGDSLEFYVKNDTYDNTYTCKVIFVKDGEKFTFSSVYNTDRFNFLISSDESSQINDGSYKVFVLFSKDNFVKTEELYFVKVMPNILSCSNVQTTSYNEKILNAIEDLLEGRMKDDYVSYRIGNRSITKMQPESLLKLRDYFADKVDMEKQFNSNGKNKGNKIKVKWVGRFN